MYCTFAANCSPPCASYQGLQGFYTGSRRPQELKDSSNLEINYPKVTDGAYSLAIFVSWMVGPRRFKFLRLLRFHRSRRRLASEESGTWDRPVPHSNRPHVGFKDNAKLPY